jgi:hypothetical protein
MIKELQATRVSMPTLTPTPTSKPTSDSADRAPRSSEPTSSSIRALATATFPHQLSPRGPAIATIPCQRSPTPFTARAQTPPMSFDLNSPDAMVPFVQAAGLAQYGSVLMEQEVTIGLLATINSSQLQVCARGGGVYCCNPLALQSSRSASRIYPRTTHRLLTPATRV